MSSPKDIDTSKRRLKAFRLSAEAIEELLRGEIEIIPVLDGRGHVERYGYQWESNAAIVICSHPEFPEVEKGALIPFVEPAFRKRSVVS